MVKPARNTPPEKVVVQQQDPERLKLRKIVREGFQSIIVQIQGREFLGMPK